MKFKKILETSPEFQETNDILFRHETLHTNIFDVMLINQENADKLNMHRKKLHMYIDVSYNIFF